MATVFQKLLPKSCSGVQPYHEAGGNHERRKSSCNLELPRVNHLLLCIPLRIGTLLLASIVMVMGWVLLLSCLYTYDRMVTIPMVYRDSGVRSQDFTSLKAVFGFLMTIGSVLIASSTLLLFGVAYEKPRLFLPYLATSWVVLTLLSLACLAIPILIGVAGKDSPAMAAALFFTLVLVTFFLGHCTLVVLTLYTKLRDSVRTDAMKLLNSINVCVPEEDVENGVGADE